MTETSTGIARRTLAKGAAWAVPTVAVAAAAPVYAASGLTTTTTTLPPCIDSIDAVGGTYPVIPILWNCPNPEANPNHWDFRFNITVSATNCPYDCVRIRVYDVPGRSSLIYTPTSHHESARLAYYVEAIVNVGASRTFPTTGDTVRYNNGASTGVTITGDGTVNDSVHALYTPGGGTGCAASNLPMARYTVEYGTNTGGSCGNFTAPSGPFDINPCIPMITATACRLSDSQDRVTVSVTTSCGVPASNFTVTQIRRSTDGSDPTSGTALFSGSTALSGAPTAFTVSRGSGSGSFYWVVFNTGGLPSRVRIARPASDSALCPTGPTTTTTSTSTTSTTTTTTTTPPAPTNLAQTSNTCSTDGNDTRTIGLSWTGSATTIEYDQVGGPTNWSTPTTGGTVAPGQTTATITLPDNNCNSDFFIQVCNGPSSCAQIRVDN